MIKFDLNKEELQDLFIFISDKIQNKFTGESNTQIREYFKRDLIALYEKYLVEILLLQFPTFPIPNFCYEIIGEISTEETVIEIMEKCFGNYNENDIKSENWHKVEKIMREKLPTIIQKHNWTQKKLQQLIENLVAKINLKLAKNELKRRLINIFYENLYNLREI